MGFLKDLDELLEKHFGKRQESCSCSKMQPVVAEMPRKDLIYTMGSADPRAELHRLSCFGGTDTKGYLLDPDDTRDALGDINDKAIGWLQGVSFSMGPFGVFGDMVGILFDDMEEYYALLGQKKRLVLKAANEYGKIAVLFDKVIEFNSLDWSMSIDHIICEVKFSFEDAVEKEKKKDE
jgi:hypothetical protein